MMWRGNEEVINFWFSLICRGVVLMTQIND